MKFNQEPLAVTQPTTGVDSDQMQGSAVSDLH